MASLTFGPVPEITTPEPLYLQMRKLRTPDWARDLPRSRPTPLTLTCLGDMPWRHALANFCLLPEA